MKARQETIPGSGLPAAALLTLLAASVALFLGWNGLLWKAPREASHVARFTVSYLAVIPLTAGMLLALRRLTWAHLITSTFVLWTAKLIVTAVLYQALARGTATNLRAVAPPSATLHGPSARPAADYQGVGSGAFAAGALRGHVRAGGQPVKGAVVYLETPAQGRAVPARETVDLVIEGARYAESLYLVHLDDVVRLVNHDATLHTARFSGSDRLPPTRPMPAGAEPSAIGFPERGVYRIHCDNHAGEGTWVVVVDHPYATRTAADGSYALEGVATGEARVVAVAVQALAAREASAKATVRSADTTELEINMDAGREIAP